MEETSNTRSDRFRLRQEKRRILYSTLLKNTEVGGRCGVVIDRSSTDKNYRKQLLEENYDIDMPGGRPIRAR